MKSDKVSVCVIRFLVALQNANGHVEAKASKSRGLRRRLTFILP